jgi:membrane protease subunit HflK
MGWNDPEDDKKSKKKDPWSGQENDGPPDLDEAFRNLQRKIKNAVGGNKGGGMDSGDDGNAGVGLLFGLIAFMACLFWFLSGFFIVEPAEEAAILRFGKYVEKVGPGLHWLPRFVDNKYVLNVQQLSNYTYSAKMLTKDENMVEVAISVIYRISNLEDYLFNVTDPIESLQQATASSLRQVIGRNKLDEIITSQRAEWGSKVEDSLRQILGDYKNGITIVSVSPQPAKAPENVQDAFDDAIVAQEDEKRFKEKAQAYKAKIIPIAKGKAERILNEAHANAAEWVLQAEGAVAEFLALLPQYNLASKIVRERMYIDSMEKVLSQSSKILVDGKSGNLLYLPLERLMAKAKQAQADHPQMVDLTNGGATNNSTNYMSGTSNVNQTSDQYRVHSNGTGGRL